MTTLSFSVAMADHVRRQVGPYPFTLRMPRPQGFCCCILSALLHSVLRLLLSDALGLLLRNDLELHEVTNHGFEEHEQADFEVCK